jgi:hypothetical protein
MTFQTDTQVRAHAAFYRIVSAMYELRLTNEKLRGIEVSPSKTDPGEITTQYYAPADEVLEGKGYGRDSTTVLVHSTDWALATQAQDENGELLIKLNGVGYPTVLGVPASDAEKGGPAPFSGTVQPQPTSSWRRVDGPGWAFALTAGDDAITISEVVEGQGNRWRVIVEGEPVLSPTDFANASTLIRWTWTQPDPRV